MTNLQRKPNKNYNNSIKAWLVVLNKTRIPEVVLAVQPDVVLDVVPDVQPDAVPNVQPDLVPNYSLSVFSRRLFMQGISNIKIIEIWENISVTVVPDVVPDVQPDVVPDVQPDVMNVLEVLSR